LALGTPPEPHLNLLKFSIYKTNYIRAGIYLKTETDFSTAHQLVERYRVLIEDMELGPTNCQLIAKMKVKTIPKLEDFIIMSREHR
jgi:hypothetical protein